MWAVFKETFSSSLYLCIFNSPGNLTLRFFSVSSQNCLCFLSFCLVVVQISSRTEGLQGVLPNVLVSTLMCNLSECSWRQLWADEPDIWRSVAPNGRRAANRCSETPENNRNTCKLFDVCAASEINSQTVGVSPRCHSPKRGPCGWPVHEENDCTNGCCSAVTAVLSFKSM